MLLSHFFETIYVPRRLRNKSENSVRLYRLCIRQFEKTLGKQAETSDLTNENIELHLHRRQNVSAATRNKELAELSAMWRLAVQEELHSGWPKVTAEPEPKRIPQAWLQPDMERLLAACMAARGSIGEVPAWLYWSTLVRLCIDTGERIGAIMQAEWTWLEDQSIYIPAESRKGGKADKWFPLSPETIELLSQLRKHSSARVILHWPYYHTYLWSRYRAIVQAAGLPTGRKCSTHRLRKTHASVAYAAGMDATELLDHSDRRTTQRYLDPRFSRQQRASDVLADWLSKPPEQGKIRKTQ
jgi:integrase